MFSILSHIILKHFPPHLALDLFVFCLLPRKKIAPRTKKKSANAAVIRSGAILASCSSRGREEKEGGSSPSPSPSDREENFGRKPK